MKICFIGTSFLGAIQAGYRQVKRDQELICDFFGVNAPAFLKALYEGNVTVGGNELNFGAKLPIFVRKDSEKNLDSGNRTFKGMERQFGVKIDLAKYDALVLVDMFYRYPLLSNFEFDDQGLIFYKERPISFSLFSKLKIDGVAGFSLSNHPQFGSVPYTRASQFLKMLNHDKAYLVPAPKMPNSNVEGLIKKDPKALDRMYTSVNRVYLPELLDNGFTFICQPEETESTRYSTIDSYSRGPHKVQQGKLDPHMNEIFGKLQFEEIVKSIQPVRRV